MAKIRINKIDAARRQLDAAIRMTFGGEDPVAIHSVVAAAHRIIRDICEKRGDIESYLRFTDWIAPGHEKDFWGAMNASSNFIKHANADTDAIHEMDDEVSDYMIAFASKWYRDLGYSPSIEMRVFIGWWAIQNIKALKPEALGKLGLPNQYIDKISGQFSEAAKAMSVLPRKGRLEFGRLSLDSSKRVATER